MKRYYSRVDWVIILIAWVPIIIAWVSVIPIFLNGPFVAKLILSLTLGGATILIASIFNNTYYTIGSRDLDWVTGPFKGKIAIQKIKSIDKYESMLSISSVFKPVLARDPLKIQFAKYDDMPFSPIDEAEFVRELTKLNPEIKLSNKINVSDQREESIAS